MKNLMLFIIVAAFSSTSYAKKACLFSLPSSNGSQTCTFSTIDGEDCFSSTRTNPTYQELYDISRSSKPLERKVAEYLRVPRKNDVFAVIYKQSFQAAQGANGTSCRSPKNLGPEAGTTANDCKLVESIVRDFNAYLGQVSEPLLEDTTK